MHKQETCRHSSLLHSKNLQQIQPEAISNGQLSSFEKSQSGKPRCRESRSPVVQEEPEISLDDIKIKDVKNYRDLSTHELVMRNRLLHEKVQRRIKLLKRIYELRKRGGATTNNVAMTNNSNINAWERMSPDKVSWNAFLEMTKKVDKN
ncbi:9271_t:CDS:2 [Ambispora leptoticha]|uniref:9271_t:CDS:1 n=1 Tax=Ambispora leptoticha TaxID=144679 RepID=A0A9N8V9P8_9GLOM|nr:9271_t:CDS:2 [Ambispora leptoticha]